MKKTLLITLAICAAGAHAQSLYTAQLAELEMNNPTLKALGVAARAQEQDALSGLTLANPEVGVSYMFGVPSDVPNKTNIEVTQEFDFPTLSGARRKAARAEVKGNAAELALQRHQFLVEAEKALIEYSYQQAVVAELGRQYELVKSMHEAAASALKTGAINQLEYNKIALEAFGAENDLEMARTDLASAERELITLNGGKPLKMPKEWPDAVVPVSFDEWVTETAAQSPELNQLRAELEKSRADLNLRKKEGLPTFSLGYVNELVKDSNYHGAALSFSLPLWGNAGRVKAAKSVIAANELQLQSAEEQFRLLKQAQYDKTVTLQRAYSNALALYNKTYQSSQDCLKLALEKKTITVLEYFTEQEDFTEHAMRFLEIHRDFLLARADLYAETL